ncbi:golgin subfamily A member 4-like [Anneissia japonica]|uniref:golgin subfamily A member 4-like n=1 Tax=Anneissia japonica TaxID=1529436 RepID=UPI00142565FF|nr:golgin subfamily A member 4-like [Anneissia japonica]
MTLNQQEGGAACQGCSQLKQELEQCKMDHVLKYTTLKEKIMLVDELIRQYQAKSQENTLLKSKLEEVASRLAASRKDCKVLEEQFSNTLKEIIPIRSENAKMKLENKQLKQNAEKTCDKQAANESLCRQLQDLLSRRDEELQTVTAKLNNHTGSDLKKLTKVKEDNVALKKDNSELKKKNSSTTKKLNTSKNRERQLRELLILHNVAIPRLKKLDKEAVQKSSDSSAEEDLIDSEAIQELIEKRKSSVSKKVCQKDQETQTISMEEPVVNFKEIHQELNDTPVSQNRQTIIHSIVKKSSAIKTPKQRQGSRISSLMTVFNIKKMPTCLSPLPPSPCRNFTKELSEDSISDEDDAMSVIAGQIDVELEKAQDSPQRALSLEVVNQVEYSKKLKSSKKHRKHFENTPQRMTRSRTRNSSSSCQENDPVLLPEKVKKQSYQKNKTSANNLQSHLNDRKSLSDTSGDEQKEIDSKKSTSIVVDAITIDKDRVAEQKIHTDNVKNCIPSENNADVKLKEPVNCANNLKTEPEDSESKISNGMCNDNVQKNRSEVNLSKTSEKTEAVEELETDIGPNLPDIKSAMANTNYKYSTSTDISDSQTYDLSEIATDSVDYLEATPDGNNELEISSNIDLYVDVKSQDEVLITSVEKEQFNELQENFKLQSDFSTPCVEERLEGMPMKLNINKCIVKSAIPENTKLFNEDQVEIDHPTLKEHHDDKNDNSAVSRAVESFSVKKEIDTTVELNILKLKTTSKNDPKTTPGVSNLYSSFVKASSSLEENKSNKVENDASDLKETKRKGETKTNQSDENLETKGVDNNCLNISKVLPKEKINFVHNIVSEDNMNAVQSKNNSIDNSLTSAGEDAVKVDNDVIAEVVRETNSLDLPERRVTRSMGDVKIGKTSFPTNSSHQTCKRSLLEHDEGICQKKQKRTVCSNELTGSMITRSMKSNKTGMLEHGSRDSDASCDPSALLPVIASVDVSEDNTSSCRTSKNLLENTFSACISSIIAGLQAKEPMECDSGKSTGRNNAVLPQKFKQSTAACKSLQFDVTEKDVVNDNDDENCPASSTNVFETSTNSTDNTQSTKNQIRSSQRFKRVRKRSVQLTPRPSLVSPIAISPLTLSHHPPPISPMSSSRGSTPALSSLSQSLPSLIPLPNPISPLPTSPRRRSLKNCPLFCNQLPVTPISPLTLPSTAQHFAPSSSISLAPRLSPLIDPQPSANIVVQGPRKRRLAHRLTYPPDVPSSVSHKSEHSVRSSPVSPPRIHASVPEGVVAVKPSRSTDRLSAFRCPTPKNIGSNQQQKSSLAFTASNALLKGSFRQSSFTKPVSTDSTIKATTTTTTSKLLINFQPATHTDQQKCHPVVTQQNPEVAQQICHLEVAQMKNCPSVEQQSHSEGVQKKGHPGILKQTNCLPGAAQQRQHHPGEAAGNSWCKIAKTRIRKKKKKKKVAKKQKSVELQRLEYQLNAERLLKTNVEDQLEFLVSQISNVTSEATAKRATSGLICFLILNHVDLLPVIKAMCESGNTSTKSLITPHEKMLIDAIAANQINQLFFTYLLLFNLSEFSKKNHWFI